VTGIVQTDMAVKIRRARPMIAKTRAVQLQELRFRRRMLRKRSNRRLTQVDFKRLKICAPQLNSDWRRQTALEPALPQIRWMDSA